jgi:hypothetical protein
MKKILIIVALISLASCSKNEEEENSNPLQEKLVGSWRFVGLFHYDLDLPNGEYFEPYENGGTDIYYENNLFDFYLNNSLLHNGSFYVTSQDSLLYRTFYQNGQMISTDIVKITKLTPTILEISPPTQTGIDDHLSRSRYEKVLSLRQKVID